MSKSFDPLNVTLCAVRRGYVCALLLFGMIAASASAENNQSNAVDGINQGLFTDVVVGEAGTNNLLHVFNGGTLTNLAGALGNRLGADFNQAQITGQDSVWANERDLIIGNEGAFNSVSVTNGARLLSAAGVIGKAASAGDNRVHISGTESQWINEHELVIGYAGTGNRLTVSNGASVLTLRSDLGWTSSGQGNAAVLHGSGTVWSNTTIFTIGKRGAGNRLEVTDGASLYNRIGLMGLSSTAQSNQVLVSGTHARWANTGVLVVGSDGAYSQLVVSNGGAVDSASGVIGDYDRSSSNLVYIEGAGSTWSNQAFVVLGREGFDNNLEIHTGGRGESGDLVIGELELGTGNRFLVRGSNATWNSRGLIKVGEYGSTNRMTVREGGQVVSLEGSLGTEDVSFGNEVLITDPGSLWTNGGTLFIGHEGSSNILTISEGARMESVLSYVGTFASSSNNRAVVTGTNSTWNVHSSLRVGHRGAGNSLHISAGAEVIVDSDTYIGRRDTAMDNIINVDGAGSRLVVDDELIIGESGVRSTLLIENSGEVLANSVMMGETPQGTGAVVTIDGGRLEVTGTTMDLRRGVLNLEHGELTVDSLLVQTGGVVILSEPFDLSGVGLIRNQGLMVATGTAHQLPSLSLEGDGELILGTGGTWTVEGDFAKTSSGELSNSLHQAMVFTSDRSHLVSVNSQNRSNTLAGFSYNSAIGSLSVGGTVTVEQVVYSWALAGSGTLRVGSGDRFYFVDDRDWSGTVEVTGDGIFQQVPIVHNEITMTESGDMVVHWPAGVGLHFDVEWSEDLQGQDFQPAAYFKAHQEGMSWTDSGASNRVHPAQSPFRLYRLRAWP